MSWSANWVGGKWKSSPWRRRLDVWMLQEQDEDELTSTEEEGEAEGLGNDVEMAFDRAALIGSAISDLIACGCSFLSDLKVDTAVAAQLLAELVNLAAKRVDPEFYGYKPYLVRLALELGADGGWGSDDCFHLCTSEGGTNGFHDPFGELEAALTAEQNAMRWSHDWSGVVRQDWAPALLESYLGDGKVLRQMAEATTPAGWVPKPATAVSEKSDSAFEDASPEPVRRLGKDEILAFVKRWNPHPRWQQRCVG